MIQTTERETYETDFYQWTIEQAQALKERNFDNVDWENIIEEIETLGRSEYSAVVSLLRRQIEHRLKVDYVPLPEYHKKWQVEILTFKKNIKSKFAPSMKPKLNKQLTDIYQDAVEIVAFEYEVDLPIQCPYSLEELLP
jgi:hypothetical protein